MIANAGFGLEAPVTIRFYDMAGRQVEIVTFAGRNSNILTADVSDFPDGIYNLMLILKA